MCSTFYVNIFSPQSESRAYAERCLHGIKKNEARLRPTSFLFYQSLKLLEGSIFSCYV